MLLSQRRGLMVKTKPADPNSCCTGPHQPRSDGPRMSVYAIQSFFSNSDSNMEWTGWAEPHVRVHQEKKNLSKPQQQVLNTPSHIRSQGHVANQQDVKFTAQVFKSFPRKITVHRTTTLLFQKQTKAHQIFRLTNANQKVGRLIYNASTKRRSTYAWRNTC